MYAHIGTVAPKPTYQGLLGVGGVVPVADVPGLEKFLTPALPMAMFHGRNGFFGAALFDKSGTHAGWWVPPDSGLNDLAIYAVYTMILGGQRTKVPKERRANGKRPRKSL